MGRSAFLWFAGWWRAVHLGALLLVLMLSPSSYTRTNLTVMARHVYLSTAPILLWFTVLIAVFSLVLTRIVMVTAQSYGLSQYALEMVIRVLVLELIPLTAALFVAIRCTMPSAVELSQMRLGGELEAMRGQGLDPVQQEVLPRVVAGVFATVTLAALSCVVALVLAYMAVYGFKAAGFPSYTHMFGHVFNSAVILIFVLKTGFFSFAVSLIPVASALYDTDTRSSAISSELRGLARLFTVILLIEVTSLVGNYY